MPPLEIHMFVDSWLNSVMFPHLMYVCVCVCLCVCDCVCVMSFVHLSVSGSLQLFFYQCLDTISETMANFVKTYVTHKTQGYTHNKTQVYTHNKTQGYTHNQTSHTSWKSKHFIQNYLISCQNGIWGLATAPHWHCKQSSLWPGGGGKYHLEWHVHAWLPISVSTGFLHSLEKGHALQDWWS